MEEQIEKVIVDNGILKHNIQWNYSPNEIRSAATRALFGVKPSVISEINSKNLTVYIKTESDYGNIISKSIINADNDLMFRFLGID